MDTPFDPNPFCGHAACCFTGHRPRGLPRPDSDAMALLRLRLMQAVRAACGGGVRTFLCGGAQGFDQLAAEAVLALRGGGADVCLLLALPAPTQADAWSAAARARYERVLRAADGVWYAAQRADAAAMLRRNRYLVEHADCCITYLSAAAGGTLYTVRYALSRGLYVYNLALPEGM